MKYCEHNKVEAKEFLNIDGIECTRITCTECREDVTEEFYNL